MKHLFFLLTAFITNATLLAQKPCDWSVNVTDSIGTYKATKDYLVYEKNFNGKSNYIFASLVLTDGVPTCNIQIVIKSPEFIKINCFDKSSKIYLQLNSGKIVTLQHLDKENCGTLIRDEKGINNRILTGYFLFKKDEFEALKKASVSYIRIKYTTSFEDFIFKKELKSELDGVTYAPENFFLNFLNCIENN